MSSDAKYDKELGDMNIETDDTQKAQAGDSCDPETFDASDPKYSELVNPRCEQQGDGVHSKWVIVCD